jgi:hypothetical protein
MAAVVSAMAGAIPIEVGAVAAIGATAGVAVVMTATMAAETKAVAAMETMAAVGIIPAAPDR